MQRARGTRVPLASPTCRLGWVLTGTQRSNWDKTSDLFLLVLVFLQVFFQGPIISNISVQRGKSKIREDADREDPWSAGSLAM